MSKSTTSALQQVQTKGWGSILNSLKSFVLWIFGLLSLNYIIWYRKEKKQPSRILRSFGSTGTTGGVTLSAKDFQQLCQLPLERHNN